MGVEINAYLKHPLLTKWYVLAKKFCKNDMDLLYYPDQYGMHATRRGGGEKVRFSFVCFSFVLLNGKVVNVRLLLSSSECRNSFDSFDQGKVCSYAPAFISV